MALDNNIMNWDDTIENDGKGIYRPSGRRLHLHRYEFRAWPFPGSAKIHPAIRQP